MESTPERRESLDALERQTGIELGPLQGDAKHQLRAAGSQAPILHKQSEQSFDAQLSSHSLPPAVTTPKQQISTTGGWYGDDDPENPYNWPLWRINLNAGLLALLAFLSPFSSAIMAPATPAILAEFHTRNDLLEAFVVSSYVLAVRSSPFRGTQ